MDSGFDCVAITGLLAYVWAWMRGIGDLHSIEGIRLETHLHKVALNELVLIRQPTKFCVVRRTIDLVVIVVQSDNVDAGKSSNLPSRTANTAANIENSHPFSETHHVCEVVLMAGDSLVKGLAFVEATEVERLAPAVFVEVSC